MVYNDFNDFNDMDDLFRQLMNGWAASIETAAV